MTSAVELSGDIRLQEILLPVHLGWPLKERSAPQEVSLDITITYNMLNAARTDDLEQGLDYTQVLNLIKELIARRTWKLLESMCFELAQSALLTFPVISAISIECTKFNIPSVHRASSVLKLTREQWTALNSEIGAP